MIKKGKAVFLISSSIGGGAQILLLNLATYLNEHFDIMIFCPEGYLSNHLVNAGFSPIISEINFKTIFNIREKVLDWTNGETVIINPFLFGTALYVCKAFENDSNCRVFSLLLNPIVRNDLGLLKKALYRFIAKYICKKSNGIGVGSPELEKEVMILTGHSPVYLENRVPNNQRPRERFYTGDEPLRVCFVGRMAEQKRPDIFVETARLTAIKKANIHFYMAGEGKLEQPTKEFVKKNIPSDTVTLMGFIDDLYPFLDSMDILLCTSEFENTPLIILNAMNASLPVVAGNVTGIPHLIRNGVDGVISDSYTAESFAKELISLADNPDNVKKMSRKAYEQATTEFSFDRFVKSYIKALETSN